MNWRIFQFGFIAGFVLAIYSRETGATGFQSFTDLTAAGFVFGVLVDALAWVLVTNWRLSRAAAQRR